MFLDIVVCDAAKENNHALGKESVLCLFTVNPDTTVCHTPRTLNVLVEYLSFFHFSCRAILIQYVEADHIPPNWPFIFTSQKFPLKWCHIFLLKKNICTH
jgi:hypothetical protein